MNIDFIKKCQNVYGNINLEDLLNILNKAEYVEIYTDGATQYNGTRKSGIGVYFGDNDERNLSKLVNTKDNNECEIMACIEALKIVKGHFIHIYTDSRLISDRMNGLMKSDKCLHLFEELDQFDFLDVKYTYVKAHSGIKGNEEADRLSRLLF